MNICGGIVVSDNTVSFVRTNSNTSLYTVGIRTMDLELSRVSRNFVYAESSHANNNHTGVYYENSRSNTLFCNQPYDFEVGFNSVGECPNAVFAANVIDLSNSIGFQLKAPTVIGNQVHLGNTWGGASHSSFGAYIAGANALTTAQNSKFFIDNDNMCENWPCPIGPTPIATTWFNDDPHAGPIPTCEQTPIDPIAPDDTELESILMADDGHVDFNEEMTWFKKAWIFENILNDASLLSNTRLDSFANAESTTSLGLLVSINRELSMPDTGSAYVAELSTEAADSLSILLWIDEELYDNSPDSTILKARRVDLIEKVVELNSERFDSIGVIANRREMMLSNAYSILDTLTASDNIDEYLRRALLYTIQAELGGVSSFSAGEWDEIYEIASLCTWEGGLAASRGQGLCMIARDSIVPPNIGCTGVNPRGYDSFEQNEGDYLLTAFPNPSSSGWYVDLEAEKPVGMYLYSDIGHLEWTKKQVSSQLIFVPAMNLASGNYFLVIRSESGSVVRRVQLSLHTR